MVGSEMILLSCTMRSGMLPVFEQTQKRDQPVARYFQSRKMIGRSKQTESVYNASLYGMALSAGLSSFRHYPLSESLIAMSSRGAPFHFLPTSQASCGLIFDSICSCSR
jgi:hypothetical protein